MKKIDNVVIIGAGAMGHGVAQVALLIGNKVTMVDIKQEFLDKGVEKIKGGMQKLEEKGKLQGYRAADMMAGLSLSLDMEKAVKNADLILEAVVEDMKIKKQVFETCGKNAPADCVIASNTSSMRITDMAKASGVPERCVGIHFFNPVPMMKLVEVIAGKQSSEDALKTAEIWANSLPCLTGKRYVPRVLKDNPGFIANRVMAPVSIYQNYILDYAQEHNIPWEQLVADVYNPFVPMDPLTLTDYVGIDIAYMTANYYAFTLHNDFLPGKVLTEMFKAKTLGMKSGKGFFDWSKGRPVIEVSKKANLLDLEVMAAIQANEGCRILEEGVVKDWTTIDKTIEAGFNSSGSMFHAMYQYEKWAKLLEETANKIQKEYLRPCELFKSGKFTQMRV